MAVVTITIKDDGVGGCNVFAESDPPVTGNDDDATPSQLAAAMIMKTLEAMVRQVEMEGKGE